MLSNIPVISLKKIYKILNVNFYKLLIEINCPDQREEMVGRKVEGEREGEGGKMWWEDKII